MPHLSSTGGTRSSHISPGTRVLSTCRVCGVFAHSVFLDTMDEIIDLFQLLIVFGPVSTVYVSEL